MHSFLPAAHTSSERARGPNHPADVMSLLVSLGQVCLLYTGIMGWIMSPQIQILGPKPQDLRTSARPVSGDWILTER